MVKRATTSALAEFAERRAELEKLAAEKLAAAQAIGDKLNGLTIEIARKAGVDGRLFGSVTNFDIAEALEAKGFKVVKSDVRMPTGPLKTIGEFPLEVGLHTDVVVGIVVTIAAAQ